MYSIFYLFFDSQLLSSFYHLWWIHMFKTYRWAYIYFTYPFVYTPLQFIVLHCWKGAIGQQCFALACLKLSFEHFSSIFVMFVTAWRVINAEENWLFQTKRMLRKGTWHHVRMRWARLLCLAEFGDNADDWRTERTLEMFVQPAAVDYGCCCC